MSIIIEGPDHVGKTTLAQKLARHFGTKIGHMSKPEGDGWKLTDFVNRLGYKDTGIWDRFHLGGIVYGELLCKHPCKMKPSDVDLLHRYMEWRGDTLVLITAEEEYLAERLEMSGKNELFDRRTILLANRGFNMLWYGLHPCFYGITVSKAKPFPTDDDFTGIIKHARERQSTR